ncbi:hypothetical protein GQ55_3G101400 [Panicum hallii var. hallii]|uniref:Uncharacterized protein n=1 Tax=Panicum hallii var. hallii TaxID=1504633 RepID=A0A2T7E7R4_9POAL|nr:hypothetical protein GQ55_3G101400 [Panicum hallii var. hallii]
MEAAEQREQGSSHSGDVMQMQSGWGQLDLIPPGCIRQHSFTRQGKRLAWPEFCNRSKLMRLIVQHFVQDISPRVKGICTWMWSHVERLASRQLLYDD